MTPSAALLTSITVFTIGALGAVTRRDLLRVLISISIMLGGVTLLLVALAQTPQQAVQQTLVLFVWAVEIVEILIAIALFVRLSRGGTSHLSDLRSFRW